jgi:serine/threonine protein kinase
LLTFEDLLAAKVAIQMGHISPEVARAKLLAAHANGKTLAQELEATATVDPALARTIAGHARRCSFLKAESTYLGLLRKRGVVAEAAIEKVRARQHTEGLRTRLGELMVQDGTLKRELDQELLGEARKSFVADNAQVTERYAARGFEGIERPSVTVSEVIAAAAAGTVPSPSDSRAGRGPNDSRFGPSPTPPGLTPPTGGVARPARPSAAMALPGMPDPGGDIGSLGHSQERRLPTALQVPIPAIPAGPAPTAPTAAAAAAAPAAPGKPGLGRTAEKALDGTGLETKYEVVKKVGEGGMGAVYLVRERDGGRQVALKLVLDQEKSQEAAKRFKREILATSMCGHENIIEIYDAGETKDHSYFMAMEYVPGEELSDIVKREGFIELPRAVDLFEQIVEGIAAVHSAQIVHRDLKPQNFRVWKDATTGRERLKIMDFGIARLKDTEGQFGDQFYKTMGGKITGSPAYIAPESITEAEVDGRADLYSLGIALFRMTTGKLPFACKDPMEYLPKHLYEKPPVPSQFKPERKIPPELDQLILHLLEKNPDKRYQTADEVLDFLRQKVRPAVQPKPSAAPATPAGDENALPATLPWNFNPNAVTDSNEATQTNLPPGPNGAGGSPGSNDDAQKTINMPPPVLDDQATIPPNAMKAMMGDRGAKQTVAPPVEAEKPRGCLGFLFGRKKKA